MGHHTLIDFQAGSGAWAGGIAFSLLLHLLLMAVPAAVFNAGITARENPGSVEAETAFSGKDLRINFIRKGTAAASFPKEDSSAFTASVPGHIPAVSQSETASISPEAAPAEGPAELPSADGALEVSGGTAGKGRGSPENTIIRARSAGKIVPPYPVYAVRKGLEGKVLLDVGVDKKGMPSKVVIRKSSGHQVLDRAAIESIMNTVFFPAVYMGTNVEDNLVISVTFSLDEAER